MPDFPRRSSNDDFQSLVQKEVADSMASGSSQIYPLIDTRFDNFKKQYSEVNSSSVEAAVKRARRDRYVFKSKGNEKQFEHAESVLEKVEGAKDALSVNAISKAKITAIEKGIALVSKRMKLIKIADKSQYSWAIVQDVFRTGWLLTRWREEAVSLGEDSKEENLRGEEEAFAEAVSEISALPVFLSRSPYFSAYRYS